MKTILISGGNRGIGLEACRQLAAKGHHVIMGSRDLAVGEKAGAAIGSNVIVKQLDVTDERSIHGLYMYIDKEVGHLDVLINNAGLGSTFFQADRGIAGRLSRQLKEKVPGARKLINAFKSVVKQIDLRPSDNRASGIPLDEVRFLMETNLYGAWRMAQAFKPLLLKSSAGRIINVSSGMGELSSLKGDYPAYRISKAALNALSIMLADELAPKGIQVNAMCPGWVRTDMGGPDAPRPVEEGADTAVWLATASHIESGKFYRDRKVIEW